MQTEADPYSLSEAHIMHSNTLDTFVYEKYERTFFHCIRRRLYFMFVD